MNAKLLAHSQIKALPTLAPAREPGAIRRVFDNSQIIERFGKWLLVCGKAENTRKHYTESARQFAKFLLDKPLTAATEEDVRAFVGYLYAKNLAATTIQSRLDALRVMGDCLQLGGLVRASVPRFILRRKVPKRLPHAISEEEIKRLIGAARNPRDLAILELGYASGLRVSELAHLRVEDVNLRAGSLTVRQGKGGNDRIALFGRPAAQALTEYIGERMSGPLFCQLASHMRKVQEGGVSRDRWAAWWGSWYEPNADGKRVHKQIRLGDYEIPTKERAREILKAFLTARGIQGACVNRKANPEAGLTVRQIFRVVRLAAKRAGITGVHPHTLRHSMATHCLNHGMDIRHVQELLGHTSLVATQKYLHVSTTNLKQVHTKFFQGA
jgi:site-specific recombinase XerD